MMNTMKRILAGILSVVMAASFAACASTGASHSKAAASGKSSSSVTVVASDTQKASGADTQSKSEEQPETVDGGWEANQGELPLDKDPDAKAAFEKATEGLTGYQYEPIALLGSQVVAGTNYCILCKGAPVVPDAKSTYLLVYIYADLSGGAEITDTKDFSESSDSGEEVTGGLEMNQGKPSVEQNADVKAAFDKALDGLVGCKYETVAYIGSQVVAGTNYVIVCRTTPVVPDATAGFSLVTVYEDLSGNAELSDVTDLVF